MLPDEMWEEVLMHLELSDLLRLQRVCKRWNEIITRIIQRGSKWYEKCVAEIPEDMWSSMLSHQTHPKIRCENFHRAKMHSEIWITMYRSWIGWNTLIEKNTSIEDIQVVEESYRTTAIFVAVSGNIMAVGSPDLPVSFYDIAESTVNPIYQVHDFGISYIVLCRNGGDVMAVAWSADELRYWDLQTKKQIHQNESRHPGRILSAHFDYFYSLCYDEDRMTWILNVEQFVSGAVRLVRSATFTDAHYSIKAMAPEGDKVLLYMTSNNGSIDKFLVNLPDNRFEALSVHEVLDDEFNRMWLASNPCFKIFNPCVATYTPRHSRCFYITVNGRPWKTYDISQDLGIMGVSSVILYHVGLLIVAIEYDPFSESEVWIYSIGNINNLDNLDFKSLKSKTLKVTSPTIDDLFVTEYNSHQHLLVIGGKKIHIVKFD